MLTGRKRRCLHDDILEYLRAAGFAETAAVFDAEKEQPVPDQIEVCALERKYASILRTAKLLSQAEVCVITHPAHPISPHPLFPPPPCAGVEQGAYTPTRRDAGPDEGEAGLGNP